MLICDRCATPVPDGARFCPACGDPVTAADGPENRAVPRTESVRLVCPHCAQTSLFTIPSSGDGSLACPTCANSFETSVVRIRSKRSTGNKPSNTRAFTVRAEGLDGRDRLLEFVRPKNEDFELRSRDLAAFSSIQGRLAIVQNLTVGGVIRLPALAPQAAPSTAGCGAVLMWLSVTAAVAALAF